LEDSKVQFGLVSGGEEDVDAQDIHGEDRIDDAEALFFDEV
jgi:hypothetical protein